MKSSMAEVRSDDSVPTNEALSHRSLQNTCPLETTETPSSDQPPGDRTHRDPLRNGAENLFMPLALERAEVPRYFRQFQNAAVLKKLAHAGKGPLYQLIGKKAWYETADIIAWLDSRKRSGPERRQAEPPQDQPLSPLRPILRRKRPGRPSKASQWRKKQGLQGKS